MSTEKIALEIEVKGAGSVKELKQGIKDAKNELLQFEVGSEGFARAQKKVSALTDSLKDLGDSASIQGTGVERLGQSFSLLGQSFASGDLDKGKLAMTGIGQAVSAIPIFLLLQGVQLLIQNFDKVIEFIPGLQTIVDIFYKITDSIGLTNVAVTKALEDNIAKTKLVSEQTAEYYDREIALLKAAGQETFLLEQQRRLEIAQTLEAQIHALNLKDAAEGKSTDNAKELIKQRKALLLEIDVSEIEYAEKRKKENLEAIELQRKKNEESLKLTLKRLEEEEKFFYNKQGAELARQAEADAVLAKQRLEAEQDYLNKQKELDNQFAALSKEQRDKDLADELSKNKKAVDDKKKSEESKKQIVGLGLNASQTLSTAFFAMQLNGAKGNLAEELKIKKKAFDVEKAFNVARAIQDGYSATMKAVAAGGGVPLGIPFGVATGLFAAANVAKILSTKFDGGGGGSIPTLDAGGGVPALPSTQSPVPSLPSSSINSTQLNGGNSDINVNQGQLQLRAYVIESEITGSQQNIQKIKRTSTFG